jgi:hypothetical protein
MKDCNDLYKRYRIFLKKDYSALCFKVDNKVILWYYYVYYGYANYGQIYTLN